MKSIKSFCRGSRGTVFSKRVPLAAGGKCLEINWYGPSPGEAPTLVFLHHGLGCAAMWRDYPEKLAAAVGCGALVYSRLGYGRSDPCSIPRAARGALFEKTALLDPLQKLFIKGDFYFLIFCRK